MDIDKLISRRQLKGDRSEAAREVEGCRLDHIIELRPISCEQCDHPLLGDDPQPARQQVGWSQDKRAEGDKTGFLILLTYRNGYRKRVSRPYKG